MRCLLNGTHDRKFVHMFATFAHVRKCKYMLQLGVSSLALILYLYECFSLSRRFYYYNYTILLVVIMFHNVEI